MSIMVQNKLPDGYHLVQDKHAWYWKVEPRPAPDYLEKYYAKKYRNPCIPHDPVGTVDLICRHALDRGRVLDIGCGEGALLAEFVKRGWKAYGIEPSLEYADLARQKGIQVAQALLTDEKAAQLGTFDVVLLVQVLEHLADPEEMVRMAKSLLGSGGLLYCEVPNDFNEFQEAVVSYYGLENWWITFPDHLNYFDPLTLSTLLKNQGFIVQVQTTDFPMEIFLLWGENYVGNSKLGHWAHTRRCSFEQVLKETGKGDLLRELYKALAKLGLGRKAIVCARKP